jgi:CRP-like cAMP-binding protein
MVTDMLEYKLFNEGEVIFKEGDLPQCAYLIHAGTVEVVVEVKDGAAIVDTLEAGEVFGEMALVDNKPRSATAIAKVPTTCATVSKKDFDEVFETAAPLTRAMLQLLVKRLRRTTKVGGVSAT